MGDRPDHSLGVAQSKCTWTKPLEIGGDKSKESVSTATLDVTGDSDHTGGIDVTTMESGDKFFVWFQSSGPGKQGKGTWGFTGGTGKLKGIKGKGTYTCTVSGEDAKLVQKGSSMARRWLYPMGLSFFFFAVPLWGSTPLGAVVQTWNYDPTHNPPLVTVKIVNYSHKDITAFNISIKETYANGHVYKHEVLEDFLGKIIAFKEVQGTANEANFRKYYGDGMLHAGAVWDEQLPVQPELTDYQAVLDVVTYMDGTAESTNADALGRIIEERQATVNSNRIATEIIKSALAEANDTTPAMIAARKIQERATVWKAQQHTKLDLDGVLLESVANEIKIVSSRNVNKRDALKQILDREEARMSVLSVHAALVKTGGPQRTGYQPELVSPGHVTLVSSGNR